jgi:hypothetical protein
MAISAAVRWALTPSSEQAYALDGNTVPEESGTDKVNDVDRLTELAEEVRQQDFSDSIPSDHKLKIVIAPDLKSGGHGVMTVDESTVIHVHPDAVRLSDKSLRWVFGHELNHVGDILKYGYQPGTAIHFRSEIKAYQWQLDNAKRYNIELDWESKAQIRDLVDDNRMRLKADRMMRGM